MTIPKLKRLRSPSYPYMSLPEAIELLKKFYNQAKSSAVDKESATTIIGFSPKGSSGNRALSTLVGFGLLQNDTAGGGKLVKIADLGMDIIYPANNEFPVRAVQKAALKPHLYKWALERWPDGLPSESVMKPALIREAHLSESAVQVFIKDLSKTFDYAKIYNLGALSITPEPKQDMAFDDNDELQTLNTTEQNKQFEDYDFALSGREVAKLRMPLPLTEKKLRVVLKHLHIMLETLEEDVNQIGGNEN